MPRALEVVHLGRVRYAGAIEVMNARAQALKRGEVGDALFLLEHEPTFTLGRRAEAANILIDEAELKRRGIEVHETGRGGDVTYHGPGQIVGYPVLDLSPDRKDVRKYVHDLEEVMIRVCGRYGIQAGRVSGLIGTWIEDARKIGAIGVRLSRWITTHGFAFNVKRDLSAFQLIVPCGIADKGVTSLEQELDRPVELDDALEVIEDEFCVVFGYPRGDSGFSDIAVTEPGVRLGGAVDIPASESSVSLSPFGTPLMAQLGFDDRTIRSGPPPDMKAAVLTALAKRVRAVHEGMEAATAVELLQEVEDAIDAGESWGLLFLKAELLTALAEWSLVLQTLKACRGLKVHEADAEALGYAGRSAVEKRHHELQSRAEAERETLLGLPSAGRALARGTVVDERYELIRMLGRGSMGAVYEARDRVADRKVALKTVLSPVEGDIISTERFEREAAVLSRLDHENVVRVHELARTEVGLVLAMELLGGTNLDTIIEDEPSGLRPARAARIIQQISLGVGSAHDLGIVHRDLKPENVQIVPGPDGRSEHVKVLDFGLAKLLPDRWSVGSITLMNAVIGNVRYMSPEQAQAKDIDHRADIYAIGALFFHLLTGAPPYLGNGIYDVLLKHIRDPVPSIGREHGDAHRYDAIVRRAMAKAPGERFDTCRALIAAINAA